ncbi:MAG: hypothetical protein UW68_C0067G0002 [Candidatus Collierbacteria bacterium GW2011_GWB1_44_6]|uniref:Uncharacterized protein n=1 Tax=Candidatus Collierbacteria bacterium GW2011_GWB1_44_6 TaxID=1618384 RepID=A0A0G1LRI7_9BACT|nr:MAG: hypothetical protein UW68_C0067G0002 [Candidatus Collierbacteria bacterium GW2011_GWB1_44_6]
MTDGRVGINQNLGSPSYNLDVTGTGRFTSITDTGLAINSAVYTDGSSVLTTTAPTSGTLGYWSRTGTTLSPSTAGDAVTTSGNISTSGTGTVTSAGLLTASNGLTLTTGALNLTGTSGALTLSGLGASSASFGANNILFTSGNFNTTATGINSTNIGATTAGSGAFTTLSSTGTTNLGQGTGVVTINSSGALNMTAASASTFTLANVSDSLNFDTNTLSLDALNDQVGIGISAQNYKLSVVDSQSGDIDDDAVVSFVNTDASANDKSVLRLGVGDTGGTNNRFITFYDSATTDNDGQGEGRIRLNAGGTGVEYQSGAADVAEYMNIPAAQAVLPGHIISLTTTGNVKATSSNDVLIGVVSDTAGFTGNAGISTDPDNDPDVQTVGIVGFVRTYMTGTVAIGDPITISSTSGVGKKATSAGYVVGKAAEAHSGVGPDRVLVFVQPGWYDPDPLANIGSAPFTVAGSGDVLNSSSEIVTRMGGFEGIVMRDATISSTLKLRNDLFTDLTGNGLTNSSGSLGINLTTSGTTGSTSSNSGLEVSSSGLTMLKGCADGEILSWNDSGSVWQCTSNGTSTALNNITAATGANSINSGDNAQVWNWALTTAAKTAFEFGENAASTNGAGSQYILGATTDALSTAAPFFASARGNKIIDTTAAGGITIGNATAAQAITIDAGTANINIGNSVNDKFIQIGDPANLSIYVDSITQEIGIGDEATTKIIEIGGSDADGADSIEIATEGTSADSISVGNGNAGTIVEITGGNDWSVSAAGALTLASLTRGTDTITDFTGNGLSLSTGAITVNVPTATDGLSATTSSGSGLEVLSAGLAMLQGCSTNQILKWNETTDLWACATDETGGGTSTLQTAYDNGNTILTTTGRDIAFTLAGGLLTPTSFTLTNLSTTGVTGQSITNLTTGVLTNGLLITENSSGAMTNGLNITQTLGTLTNGIFVTGTLTNILNTDTLDITGAGAITGATGVTLTSGNITTPGNISTTSTGTITSASTLTASSGFTMTTGALNLTATSGTISLTGLSTSSITNAAGGAFSITTGTTGALTLDSGTTGAINIGTGANAKTITLGNTTTTTVELTELTLETMPILRQLI